MISDKQIEEMARDTVFELINDGHYDEPRTEVSIADIDKESYLAVDELRCKIWNRTYELLKEEDIEILE